MISPSLARLRLLLPWQHLVAPVPGVSWRRVNVTPPPVVIRGLVRFLKCVIVCQREEKRVVQKQDEVV